MGYWQVEPDHHHQREGSSVAVRDRPHGAGSREVQAGGRERKGQDRGEEWTRELLLHDEEHAKRGEIEGQVRGRRQGEDREGPAGHPRLVGQEPAGREGRVRIQAERARRCREPDHDEGVPGSGWRRWHARGRHARWWLWWWRCSWGW